MLVLLAIVALLEHRLTGALDVAVKELVGVGIFLLVQKPDAAVVEIGTDMSQIVAVTLAELKVPPALLVGRSLYGVILKRHLEELAGVVEELRRIVFLLQIQLLVTLLILFANGVEVNRPDFPVGTVRRVGKQFLHACRCLVEILSRLHLVLSCLNLLLLSRGRHGRHQNQKHQRKRLPYINLPFHHSFFFFM